MLQAQEVELVRLHTFNPLLPSLSSREGIFVASVKINQISFKWLLHYLFQKESHKEAPVGTSNKALINL